MAADSPAPISDAVLATLEPLVCEAMDAFQRDISYGVAIVSAGRKVVTRKPAKARVPAHAA